MLVKHIIQMGGSLSSWRAGVCLPNTGDIPQGSRGSSQTRIELSELRRCHARTHGRTLKSAQAGAAPPDFTARPVQTGPSACAATCELRCFAGGRRVLCWGMGTERLFSFQHLDSSRLRYAQAQGFKVANVSWFPISPISARRVQKNPQTSSFVLYFIRYVSRSDHKACFRRRVRAAAQQDQPTLNTFHIFDWSRRIELIYYLPQRSNKIQYK